MREPRAGADDLVLTWIGHSTFLIQIGALNILTDPVWSERASPLRFVGPRRWVAPGVALSSLPPVDAVLVSHDHYDHLDARTVRWLAAHHPDALWLAPLGVARRLRGFRVRSARELDWWQGDCAGSVTFTCTPARHWSGRSFIDRGASLWCGWMISARSRRVFFAGDTAYHPEMRSLVTRLGPVDAALLPVGGYEPSWYMRHVHMSPEEAVQAYVELAAPVGVGSASTTVMVPMHWGTFKLADEAMDEPPRRTREAWAAAGLPPRSLWIPTHGESRSW